MKILLTGAKGMLGSEIARQVKQKAGWEITETDAEELDITDKEKVDEFITKNKPDALINSAAYTNVDGCEDNPELCNKVNGYAVGNLASSCKKHEVILVHISSDQVFGENKKEGYDEDYTIFHPLNKYAESKLLGEKQLLENTDMFYLVRTEWLFGVGAKNFISKMLELGGKMDTLKVVTDEIGKPTYVKDLAEKLLWTVENKPSYGVYHLAAEGSCSRNEFAKEIFKVKKMNVKVEPTTLSEFQRKAQVPNISLLNNTKLPKLRKWQEMVEDYLINET